MLQVLIDSKADAMYLWLDDTADAVEGEEVEPGVILHFNAAGRVIGVELLDVSTRLADGSLAQLQFRLDDAEATLSLATTALATPR